MILHIPHSSTLIPPAMRGQFLLAEGELRLEALRMVDSWTRELFAHPTARMVTFPWCRLLVDVERFRDDAVEERASVGMGAIYTRTSGGEPLRRPLVESEVAELLALYDAHHQALHDAVEQELAGNPSARALLVDCHSFPSRPLPCDRDQRAPRPDICLGTDPFHTPDSLLAAIAGHVHASGLTLGINWPYSCTMVPMRWYRQSDRVVSIMVEINRALYMDEYTGHPSSTFDECRAFVSGLLDRLAEYESACGPSRTGPCG